MKRKCAIVIFSVLLLWAVVLPASVAINGNVSSSEREFVIKSSVRFTSYEREWGFSKEEKAISLYMNNSWQSVYLINSSHSFENIQTDEDGNKIAMLDLSDLNPNQSTEYTVFYQVVSKPRNLPTIDENSALNLTDIPNDLKETYCNNSGTWMTNNTALRNLAENLAENEKNVLAIVGNFVAWMWDKKNMNYTSNEVPKYPNETLSSGGGDCDDQAILLTSLCRIIGIPAYLQLGCIYKSSQTDATPSYAWNSTIGNIQIRIGWHGWAMVYIPPWGWLPVDLTYTSSRSNSLDAIETAAVTSQNVMQYMNVVQTDYVSDARKYRSFLITNSFYIQVYDEIIPGRGTDPFDFLSDWLDTLISYMLVAFLVAGIVGGSVVGLFYVRRMRKKGVSEPIGVSSQRLCGRRLLWRSRHPVRLRIRCRHD